MEHTWTSVCDAAEIQPETAFACEVEGRMIAVYQVDERYFATDNICPHAYALLSDGWLEGMEIECPLHGARFDIATGAVLEGPAECALKTYPVRLEGSQVQCLV